jgi:hypothetical protein
MLKIVFLLASICFFIECSPENPPQDGQAISDQNTAIEKRSRSALPDILKQIDGLLAGSAYEAHYLGIGGRLSLSIWLVDPALDPTAHDEEALRANSATAVQMARKIILEITSRLPVIKELFEGYNPMIVDTHFNAWYIDIVTMKEITETNEYWVKDKIEEISKQNMLEHAGEQSLPAAGNGNNSPVAPECWREIRSQIRTILGEDESRKNTGAYIIIQRQKAMLQIFTQITKGAETIQKKILKLIAMLSQYALPLDNMEIYFVGAQGLTQCYSSIAGTVIRDWPRKQLSAGEIVIRPMGY